MQKKLQKSCNLNITRKEKKNICECNKESCMHLSFAGQYSSPSSACLVLKSKKTWAMDWIEFKRFQSCKFIWKVSGKPRNFKRWFRIPNNCGQFSLWVILQLQGYPWWVLRLMLLKAPTLYLCSLPAKYITVFIRRIRRREGVKSLYSTKPKYQLVVYCNTATMFTSAT